MAGEGDKVQPLDAMRRSGNAQQQAEGVVTAQVESLAKKIVKSMRDRDIMQSIHNWELQIKAHIKALEEKGAKTTENEARLGECWDFLDYITEWNSRIIQGQRPRR